MAVTHTLQMDEQTKLMHITTVKYIMDEMSDQSFWYLKS